VRVGVGELEVGLGAPHGVGESTAPGDDDYGCARAPNQLEDGGKAHALG
jgi:hypothetical protein